MLNRQLIMYKRKGRKRFIGYRIEDRTICPACASLAEDLDTVREGGEMIIEVGNVKCSRCGRLLAARDRATGEIVPNDPWLFNV